LFCVGCRKHCHEFPANLNYFPYQNGQELKFTNSQYNFKNFIIASKKNTKAYSFAWNCKCECDIFSRFSINENQDSLSIKEAFLRLGGGGEYISSIYIDFQFQYDYLTKELDVGKLVPYDEIYKYIDDTIVIENENNQIVKKIVIVKGKGLISYTTADGEEWKLVE